MPAVLPGAQLYSGFRPASQARWLNFLEVHFYPLARGFYEYSIDDESRNLAYLKSVVCELAACAKPVVLAEFGWYGGGSPTVGGKPRRAASEAEQARWRRLAVETTVGPACGRLNWGFYDEPLARDVSQLTGLLTVDGKAKAWAHEFRSLAQSLASRRVAPRSLGPRPALDWNLAIIDPKASQACMEQYLEAFRNKSR